MKACRKCGKTFDYDDTSTFADDFCSELCRNNYQLEKKMIGWVCPRCGTVYSPLVKTCEICSGGKKTKPEVVALMETKD